MDIEDIVKSIRIGLHERMMGPAIPGFLISWAIWNYEFLMILASKNSITMTFFLVEKYCFPTTLSVLTHGIIFPAASAATYIYLWPYPAKRIYSFWRERQKELLVERRKIEDETPLTLEESREIRAAIRDREKIWRQELDEKNLEINNLKSVSEKSEVALSLSGIVEDFPQHPSQKEEPPEIQEQEISILNLFVKGDTWTSESEIISDAGFNEIKTRFILKELLNKKMLEITKDDNRVNYYRLTHDGRGLLIRLNLV